MAEDDVDDLLEEAFKNIEEVCWLFYDASYLNLFNI
jgi:hypothetical protein